MKSTPHIQVNKEGVIAKLVLMPGDPYRAKFIAENFLENPVCFNHIRGMLGYTGYYKGVKVSIMGSGMGMPSIGIYSYELFSIYDVDVIIRIGSAGAYSEKLELFDVILVDNAYTESTYARAQGGEKRDRLPANPEINDAIRAAAKLNEIPYHEGDVHSSDVFYRKNSCRDEMLNEKNCLAVEMEAFALFHNANVTGKKAGCILTISDSLVKHSETTPEERQNCFVQMATLGFETLKILSEKNK